MRWQTRPLLSCRPTSSMPYEAKTRVSTNATVAPSIPISVVEITSLLSLQGILFGLRLFCFRPFFMTTYGSSETLIICSSE